MLSQNPAETYQYYDLPFCRPKGDKLKHKRAGLGEVVDGNRLV
jgi:transmembrane 9 superfamily member 3